MLPFQSRLFLRFIFKNREVYLLKVITLAIAFTCSTLVALFSLNEFGYDQFHDDPESVFRILERNSSEDYHGNRLYNRVPANIFLQVKKSDSLLLSRVKVLNELVVVTNKDILYDQKIHAVDTNITEIFSFEILDGSIKNFYNNERTVLLSTTQSLEYFGTPLASGKQLGIYAFGDTLTFSVAAVYKDFPQNSHEAFNTFIRFNNTSLKSLNFDPFESAVYGRINSGDVKTHQASFNSILPLKDISYIFQPLPEIYFGPRVLGEDVKHADYYSILILISISSLILFLALISFVNLTMLTLPYRSKELALKKIVGASQVRLLITFAKESFSIVGISLGTGLLLLFFTANWLAPILSINIITLLLEGNGILFLIITALFLLLGLSPLFLVMNFTRATPNRLLSTDTITFPRLKRISIILQLGISIFLIVAAIVIKRQVNYSLLKEPGQNHDQVVYMNYPKDLTEEGLRNLRVNWKKQNAHIVDVMAVSQLPDQVSSKDLNSGFYLMQVDPSFREFFDLKIINGKWFKANDGDSIIVVNQTGSEYIKGGTMNLAGVIENINGRFNLPEKPLKISLASYANYNFLCVRVLEVDIRQTVNYLSGYFEGNQRPVSFMNKQFGEWLTYQDRLNYLSEILAIVSGLLSCCAIYGISISLVRDKLKQIAIHKICGANIFSITKLLAAEFGRQLLIAVIIFAPVTYIILKELLRNFVYATRFYWSDPIFPLAYCIMVIILLCGFQALSLNRSDLSGALKG